MLELTTTFTPADGSAQRTITLRISDVRPDPDGHTWSVAVDILGFQNDESVRLKQVDWSTAIQDAARFISGRVTDKVALAGGGRSMHLSLLRTLPGRSPSRSPHSAADRNTR